MEERDWLILKILFQQKNITKTAQHLFISQPALTNRLRQIEEEFKVTIVHRGRRGVHFTPQGEYLANCADDILLKLRKTRENVLNMSDTVSGVLRIGTSRYIAKYKLPHILRAFSSLYPEVSYKLITGWSRDIHHYVYNEEVHVGFFRGDYLWQDAKHLLFEDELCITSKNPFKLEDLPKLPRIFYQTDNLYKTIIDNWWNENFSLPPSMSMEVDQLDTCKEMVVNGFGYAIIPSSILNGIDNLYKIGITKKNGEPILQRAWMVYHQESTEINVVKAFVEFVSSYDFGNTRQINQIKADELDIGSNSLYK